ncbi:uncharacterized protein [Triticum aestivum]|uniref:uncharacterized protein isoform X2 n=1 Tax=Triticum aestivum TaxID=4565 RepID=UPI001D00D393|nr:uncharacterized protein LOC123128754 isoform X2 [Triticum aestivum]
MAMALRTMAAKLKQKISAAVQWVRVSSHAPAHADTNLDPFGLEFRRALEKIVEKHRKRRRNEALACGAGFSLGALTFLLGLPTSSWASQPASSRSTRWRSATFTAATTSPRPCSASRSSAAAPPPARSTSTSATLPTATNPTIS